MMMGCVSQPKGTAVSLVWSPKNAKNTRNCKDFEHIFKNTQSFLKNWHCIESRFHIYKRTFSKI